MFSSPEVETFVPGDATGIALPADADALRAAGTAFLTEAFHRFGALPLDNRVVGISRCESFAGGNSGHKLWLSVEYAYDHPDLHRDLFVKFSRDFEDAFRDRRKYELAAEVRLATLSRLPAFPVRVAKAYFADFHQASGTGLLITQCIAFGRDGIEPLREKFMDHQLADSLPYYRATVTALARLAAAHHAGRLSPQVDALFPFDAKTAIAEFPIPYDASALRERIARYATFAARCPQLLPPHLTEPAFLTRLEADALRLLRHEAAIKQFLYADPRLVALCHWNTNIDNAWFWRNAAGALECGLLDWGMARQMSVACGLWGGLCGAGLHIWDQHLDQLLVLFTDELHANGGPRVDPAMLQLHLELYTAMLGLALLMDVPELVLARLPEAAQARDLLDPILRRNEVARGFLNTFIAFLNLWQRRDFGASLDRMLRQVAKE